MEREDKIFKKKTDSNVYLKGPNSCVEWLLISENVILAMIPNKN